MLGRSEKGGDRCMHRLALVTQGVDVSGRLRRASSSASSPPVVISHVCMLLTDHTWVRV